VTAVSGDSAAAGAGRLHALLDRLATRYGEAHRDELAAAREDYFNQAGKVFEDDGDLWERRVAAFLEWFVCERPLAGGPAPVVQALTDGDGGFSAEERLGLAALASSHRSLFDIAHVADGHVLLEDVVAGARFSVLERRSTIGFEIGDLLEARVIWAGDEAVFGKTFLFHPRDAREQALDVVDAGLSRGDSRDAIIFHLARLHVRWHRQGHVAAARVYREGLVRGSGPAGPASGPAGPTPDPAG
jgi:hypothetical protein